MGKRVQSPVQDKSQCHDENRIVDQEQQFAGKAAIAGPAHDGRRPQPVDRQRAAHGQRQQGKNEESAFRVHGERMHRGQYPGTDDERTEQRQ